MTTHLWGLHHLAYHLEETDWQHIAAMQYRSAKVFEWCWRDAGYVSRLLSVMPQDALFLARDYPLSEQRDWQGDPVGTANRQADDWANKVQTKQCLLPPDRTYFLGANEPEVWSYRQQAIDYTAAFVRRLATHGLRGGALNLSVGWPGTADGTANTLPDWTAYEPVHQAIVETGSLLVLHEYGAHDAPGWGYWLMRLQHCPWQDVRIVIGECGINDAVRGGDHLGWQHCLDGAGYARYLDAYHAHLSADRRIHSAQVFTYDFSPPWGAFDLRPARQIWESYPWTTRINQPPVPVPPVVVPPIPVQDEFERCLAFVLRWEGGYANNPADPGGETNWGISKRSYPNLDIASLTREEAAAIYHSDYWLASGADKLAWPLNLLVFDAAVNCGVGRALAFRGNTVAETIANRIDWYTRIHNFGLFGPAWMRRCADLIRESVRNA